MSTIAEKLNEIYEIKVAIKAALISKGINAGNDFSKYAELITNNISSGGDTHTELPYFIGLFGSSDHEGWEIDLPNRHAVIKLIPSVKYYDNEIHDLEEGADNEFQYYSRCVNKGDYVEFHVDDVIPGDFLRISVWANGTHTDKYTYEYNIPSEDYYQNPYFSSKAIDGQSTLNGWQCVDKSGENILKLYVYNFDDMRFENAIIDSNYDFYTYENNYVKFIWQYWPDSTPPSQMYIEVYTNEDYSSSKRFEYNFEEWVLVEDGYYYDSDYDWNNAYELYRNVSTGETKRGEMTLPMIEKLTELLTEDNISETWETGIYAVLPNGEEVFIHNGNDKTIYKVYFDYGNVDFDTLNGWSYVDYEDTHEAKIVIGVNNNGGNVEDAVINANYEYIIDNGNEVEFYWNNVNIGDVMYVELYTDEEHSSSYRFEYEVTEQKQIEHGSYTYDIGTGTYYIGDEECDDLGIFELINGASYDEWSYALSADEVDAYKFSICQFNGTGASTYDFMRVKNDIHIESLEVLVARYGTNMGTSATLDIGGNTMTIGTIYRASRAGSMSNYGSNPAFYTYSNKYDVDANTDISLTFNNTASGKQYGIYGKIYFSI